MADKETYFSAVGRRKGAVARVRLFNKGGVLTVNGKPVDEYFKGIIYQKAFNRPFEIVNGVGKFSGSVVVAGGGIMSQVGASVHGIARALVKANEEQFRKLLKAEGLLTRDPRVRERRKYGNAQKARAKKQSPKR